MVDGLRSGRYAVEDPRGRRSSRVRLLRRIEILVAGKVHGRDELYEVECLVREMVVDYLNVMNLMRNLLDVGLACYLVQEYLSRKRPRWVVDGYWFASLVRDEYDSCVRGSRVDSLHVESSDLVDVDQ